MEPPLDPPLAAVDSPRRAPPCFVCKRPRCERCALAYCSVDCSNRAFLSHEQRCRRLVPRDAECVDDAAEATLCPTCDEELRKCWMCAMLGDPG